MRTHVVTGWGEVAQSPMQRLGRVPLARRRRLATVSGAAHADAASLADHLAREDVAFELLESLSPEARVAARILVEAADALPAAILDAECERRLGSAEAGAAALEALERAGLTMRPKWAGGAEVVGLAPPLSRSLRPFLWLLGDEAPAGRVTPERIAERASVELRRVLDLALALGAAATEPPRLLREGGVHQADLRRLTEQRFPMADAAQVEAWIVRLVSLGLYVGEGSRVRIEWERTWHLFDLPPAVRLPALLASDPPAASAPRAPGLASAGHVRRLLAAALLELPADHWAKLGALEDAVRLRLLAADALSPYADLARAATLAERHVRAAARAVLPCLETASGNGAGPWVRLPVTPEEGGEGQWVVQPDHEIIVPPEVPAGDVARLAAFADLARADVVSTWRIGPGSVARAVRIGLEAGEILDRLAEGSSRPLPVGLDGQVETWARQAGPDLYGLPILDEAAEPAPEVAVHRYPVSPALPARPARRWSSAVARFRRAAAER